MATQIRTYFKRQLPAKLIAFSSQQGKLLFKKALAEGNAEIYFHLANYYTTQSEPAFCGLGTLSMVLNSLEVDPLRVWKGPWRWYADEMLDCCRSLEDVRVNGITLSEFTCLSKCNGLSVMSKFGPQSTPAEFESDLIRSCSSDEEIAVLSYSRPALGQTGDGHFSPIGAYVQSEQMALVMDVARFKYPAYWVPLEMLHSSMLALDSASNKPRGYALLKKNPSMESSLTKVEINKFRLQDLVSKWANLGKPDNIASVELWQSLSKDYLEIGQDVGLVAQRTLVIQEDEAKPPIIFSCKPQPQPSKEHPVGLAYRSQFELLVAGVKLTPLYHKLKPHFPSLSNTNLELMILFFLSIPYKYLFKDTWSPSLLLDINNDLSTVPNQVPAITCTTNTPTSDAGCPCVGSSIALAQEVLTKEINYLNHQFTYLSMCVREEHHSQPF